MNGAEPVVTVKTSRGYRISGTTMHRIKVVDAQVEFFKDANGVVTHLILHQGGRNTKGLRQP